MQWEAVRIGLDWECAACPEDTVSPTLADELSLSECTCAPSFYGNNSSLCVACPTLATSPAGSANITNFVCPSEHYKSSYEYVFQGARAGDRRPVEASPWTGSPGDSTRAYEHQCRAYPSTSKDE